MRLRPAGAGDLKAMAGLHALCFPRRWDVRELEALMANPGALAFVADEDEAIQAFVLAWALGDEAEILTLATAPQARRQGLGQALMTAVAGAAAARGALALILEVAEDNFAALALYEGLDFTRSGVRPGYYARPGGARIDALLLRRSLNSAPACG